MSLLVATSVTVQGVLFWLPLGRHHATDERPLESNDECGLRRLVGEVATEVGTRPPARIVLTSDVNAYASFHRGLPGVFTGDTKLTVGLPLLDGLEPDELQAILAHELAHLRDASAMRVCAIAFEIEGGLTRMTGHGSRRIRAWHREKQRLTVFSVAGLAVATLGEQVAAALIAPVRGPCRRLRERLVLAMEFRADAAAARAVGAAAVIGALRTVGELAAELAADSGDNLGRQPRAIEAGAAARKRARRFRERTRREGRRGGAAQWKGGEDALARARIERLRPSIDGGRE